MMEQVSGFRFPFSANVRFALLAFVFVPFLAQAADSRKEERNEVVAIAEIDRSSVALSGSLQLTLSVEGPARVEVTPPRPLLQKASAQAWLVKEMGLPSVENLERGRQRWRQEFRLEPYEAGPKVEIVLTPLKVKRGDQLEEIISWTKGPFVVQVTTSIARVDSQALRPVTDIETLPDKAEVPRSSEVVWVVAGSTLALLLALIAGLRIGQRRRTMGRVRVFGADWALGELDRIGTGPARFDLLAETMRLYLQQRFGVPATRLTTSELKAALPEQFPQAVAMDLETVLHQCDVAKFASGVAIADADGWNESMAKSKEIVKELNKSSAKG